MAGLVPAIHALTRRKRGCPAPGYAQGFAAAFLLWHAEALAEAARPGMTT